MRSITINPAKICQPIGAMYALLGFHATVPLVHGSQGCAAYPMRMFNRHFREPVQIAVTALGEDAAVFGGKENLITSINNVIKRKHPDIIGVLTTCLSETIGDDVDGMILEGDFTESKVVPIHTPSYVGSHVTGYDNALKALASSVCEESEANEEINIIPGMVNPGDILEIRRLLYLLGVKHRILSDNHETLEAPLVLPKPRFPEGGTTVDELKGSANAIGTISLCEHAGGSAASLMAAKFKMKHDAICPIGVSNTDRFIESICDIVGFDIPDSIEKDRGRLLDAMADVHQTNYGKKAAIFGDPDISIGISEFVTELGMDPVVISSSTASRRFAQEAKEITSTEILNGADLYELHRAVRDSEADILFGNTKCKQIAKDEDITFVRVGFPVYDRVGYHRYGIMGYRGATYLSDLIVNSILENGS